MSATATAGALRSELGDFSSIICFRAVVIGVEQALGEKAAMIALVSAGRARGKDLVKTLNLEDVPLAEAVPAMQKALGPDGTRLCIIDKVEEVEVGYRVYCRETVCSADEPQGSSRELSFTLGAVQGALEALTGERLRGKQVESVLRGGSHDVVELSRLG